MSEKKDDESAVNLEVEWVGDGLLFRSRVPGEPGIDSIIIDEKNDAGSRVGATPVMLIGAAIASCLSSSLLFCMSKKEKVPDGFKARVRVTSGRNQEGRLRLKEIDITLVPETNDDSVVRRIKACEKFFEQYCTVTESVRAGIPVNLHVEIAPGDDKESSG